MQATQKDISKNHLTSPTGAACYSQILQLCRIKKPKNSRLMVGINWNYNTTGNLPFSTFSLSKGWLVSGSFNSSKSKNLNVLHDILASQFSPRGTSLASQTLFSPS